MELELAGKTALVGGGTQGIGAAAADALALRGATVWLLARTEADLQRKVAHLPRPAGQTHGFLAMDLLNLVQVQALAAQLPAVQIWVNNTGGPPAGPLTTATVDALQSAFTAHVLASQLLLQAVLPGMRGGGYGRIVNVISTSVKAPLHNLGVSNTMRAAVANWAKTLATELAPEGITVNNVLPGATRTGRLEGLLQRNATQRNTSVETEAARMEAEIPLRRFAQPDEVAEAIAFLASPAATYITGINLPVDGGRLQSL